MENISKKSLFMADDSKGNVDEAVIDYFLSWTLRCACQENVNGYPKLVNKYSKIILETLLGGDELPQIKSVKTWKQSRKVDLWVEIETADNQKHALLIETKVYSGLRDNQLQKNKERFEDWYKNQNEEFQHHYCLIACYDPEKHYSKECEEAGFKSFSIDSIFNALREKLEQKGEKLQLTGSDLFDEFWFSIGWC